MLSCDERICVQVEGEGRLLLGNGFAIQPDGRCPLPFSPNSDLWQTADHPAIRSEPQTTLQVNLNLAARFHSFATRWRYTDILKLNATKTCPSGGQPTWNIRHREAVPAGSGMQA